MGVYQHHDAVSGTAKQRIAESYVTHLSNAMAQNNDVYGKILKDMVKNDLNLSVSVQSTFFNGIQNDTVAQTPMGTTFKDEQELVVVVHNPSAKFTDSPVKIQVPSNAYSVQVWNPKTKHFYNITEQCSFMRQHHRFNNGTQTLDYNLHVPFKLFPNQVGYIKLQKLSGVEKSESEKASNGNQKTTSASKFNASLELIQSDKAPIRFRFTKNYTDGNSTHVLS